MMYLKIDDLKKYLGLIEAYTSTNSHSVKIYAAEVVRPGLQLAGFFDWFSHERIQVLGKTEVY